MGSILCAWPLLCPQAIWIDRGVVQILYVSKGGSVATPASISSAHRTERSLSQLPEWQRFTLACWGCIHVCTYACNHLLLGILQKSPGPLSKNFAHWTGTVVTSARYVFTPSVGCDDFLPLWLACAPALLCPSLCCIIAEFCGGYHLPADAWQ